MIVLRGAVVSVRVFESGVVLALLMPDMGLPVTVVECAVVWAAVAVGDSAV